MKALLEIQSLSLSFPEKELLRDFRANASEGEIISLIGRNGTGKTTLLRSIAGLHRPQQGTITLNGLDSYQLTPKERAQHVAFVSTKRVALAGITVLQLVATGRHPFSGILGWTVDEDYTLALDSLKILGAEQLGEKPLAELSDGEMQKVMIARALTQRAPLLVMDEPTAFLDYVAKEELMSLLVELSSKQKLAILFSTHDIALAEKFSTVKWKLENQRIEIKKH